MEATATKGEPAVKVTGLSHYFGSGPSRTQVLTDINLEVHPGEMVILTGPTGSGKTTLLTIIGALRTLHAGEVVVLGKPLSGLDKAGLVHVRRELGFIFQMHNLFDSLTVYENVKLATDLQRYSAAEEKQRIESLLTRLGLGQRLHFLPSQLSGGQRQRAAIARALVNRPKLILADEPTAALDKEAGHIVVSLLQELAKDNGSSIVLVTHDKRILETADRIMNLLDGKLVETVATRTESGVVTPASPAV
jgi:putative ABC transport system ATP-binding protein